MPVAVVIPTGNCKTATDRSAEEAQILFPNLDDTGLDIAEFSIVIVFNEYTTLWEPKNHKLHLKMG